jgi:hypothetical protein
MAMAMAMATHITRHHLTEGMLPQLSLHRLLKLHPPAARLLTHMLSMAATRTIWQCGTRPSLSNSKVVNLALKDPQALSRSLVTVTDAHLADLRRQLLHILHDRCLDSAVSDMIIPDFLDYLRPLLNMRLSESAMIVDTFLHSMLVRPPRPRLHLCGFIFLLRSNIVIASTALRELLAA